MIVPQPPVRFIRPRSVLILESYLSIRKLLRRLLDRRGYFTNELTRSRRSFGRTWQSPSGPVDCRCRASRRDWTRRRIRTRSGLSESQDSRALFRIPPHRPNPGALLGAHQAILAGKLSGIRRPLARVNGSARPPIGALPCGCGFAGSFRFLPSASIVALAYDGWIFYSALERAPARRKSSGCGRRPKMRAAPSDSLGRRPLKDS